MNPLSVRLNKANQRFLDSYSASCNTSKTDLINEAVDELRKKRLSDELNVIANRDLEENKLLSEAGMDTYLALLERYEAFGTI